MQLSRVQKNELFQALVEGGLTPAEFELVIPKEDPPSLHRVYIRHLPSDSIFQIFSNPQNDSYSARGRLGTDPLLLYPNEYNWAKLRENFKDWMGQLKEYLETPDLWEDMRQERNFLGSTLHRSSENTPFTPNEQSLISVELRQIREYVKKTYTLSGEQMSHIEARLAEAEEASKRIGRKDWLLLFSGTIFTLIVTDLVTPDVAQHILVMAVHALGHLFDGGPPPIQPPGLP